MIKEILMYTRTLSLDELSVIIPKKKNKVVGELMQALSKKYERIKEIPGELGINPSLPEQDPSLSSSQKRKTLELEHGVRIASLECNRSLPEGVQFVNNKIDTRTNGDALRKCNLEGLYKPTIVTIPAVPVTDDTPAVSEQTSIETILTMSPENKAYYESKKEAIHLLLTGIGDEIYSTIDACKTSHEMWISIERLQQGESLNFKFYKMMNEMIRNNLTVATMQVNVQFLQQLQPEWSRFVTIVKQQHDLDTVSYHKLFDVLKQYQKEVNEIRAERIAKNANPLALVVAASPYPDPYYQAPKSHKPYAPTSKQSSSTRSNATTKFKGIEIAKPIIPPSKSASEEDNDPEQAQRDKDMQKNLTLIAKYFKKIYKPTNNLKTSLNSRNKNVDTSLRYKNDNQTRKFGNQMTLKVAGARETVGGQLVQNTGIQCFNYKEFAEKGVLLQEEQTDWLEDTDEEIDEQELEAHYSFMAKIQEWKRLILMSFCILILWIMMGQTAKHVLRMLMMKRVALANLIANLKLDVDENKKIQKQLKKANTSLAHELKECKSILAETSRTLGESNSIRDSCLIALQNKQTELERYKTLNDRTVDYDKLEHKLNETLGLLAQKEIDIKEGLKLKAYEISVVKEKHDELVKQSLLTKSHYEGLVKEKTKVITDLKLKEEKDIDKMISMEKQLKFLNEIVYKRNQSIQTIHMLAPKGPTFNGRPTFANPMYLKKAQSEKPCLYEIPYDQSDPANKLVPDQEETLTLEKKSRSKLNKDLVRPYDYTKLNSLYEIFKPSTQEYHEQLAHANEERIFKSRTKKKAKTKQNQARNGKDKVKDSLERKSFSKTKSVPKTNVSEGLSKPVTTQILPQTARQAVRNTNVIKPGMYQIDTRTTQTRAPQLPQTSRNTNPRVSTSTGVIHRTNVSRPQLRSTQMKDKVVPNNSQVKFKKTEVEDHHRISSISNKTKSVTACNDSLKSRTSNVNVVCATCGKCVFNSNHDACVSKFLNDVNARTKKPKDPICQVFHHPLILLHIVQLILFIVDSGCIKHMMGNLKLLCNFIENIWLPFVFGNDQFSPILSYGDLVQGNIMIKRFYYVEGLDHNLFSVGQFCDADLETVVFCNLCVSLYIYQDMNLLTSNRGYDLYTFSLQETTSLTTIYFMAKALPTQAWLWHRRLSHLNFDYINLLSKKDIVIGLPKLKYVKDQLCSSCKVSKAKRSSFKTKVVPSSKGRLNLLHTDLCGPMRVASINGKKYILVIVDDYSRYTWTLFLRSKDETPEVLKDFLTMIQRNLQALVISVRTDRGTEFLNKTLHAFFKEEGIEHQTYIA
ncbi:retrovirus-related pol polyprotein from transposon TNT 1-94 [Tanacetum coccineum]|uniref:Retrovirus-related pol polyprotein from transposon TNT 1-94 n=1 Tax=Tanacetum coccineum TaxID=301880 RepID=A0ABQ5AJ11_9ASTR